MSVLPYVVDYYFELTDETIAAQYGIELNGNVIRASKAIASYPVVVNYLTIANEVVKANVLVTFNHVAPEAALTNVTWTIQADDKDTDLDETEVFLPLGDLQASLVGSMDSQLPTVSKLSWTWADGDELNDKSVLVNSHCYGKAVTTNGITNVVIDEKTMMPVIDGMYYYDADDEVYYKATSTTTIQTPLYIKFKFTPTTVLPGEFKVRLGLKKGGNTGANNDFEVPVSVSVLVAEAPIVKYDNYFSGNDAVVYGDPYFTNKYVEFNLTKLFRTTGLVFAETPKARTSKANYQTLLKNVNTGYVKLATADTEDYAEDKVYGSREYTARLYQFENNAIPATEYVFNVTYKSAIKEGTFTSTASKTISTSEPVKFFVTDFTGVDVYGDNFYFGNTYKYDSKGVFVGIDNAMSTKIVGVKIEAADQNAKDYLTIGTMDYDTNGDPSDHFKVSRKTDLPQLKQDATCTVKVVLTDAWGVKSEAAVTVVVKAFGN